ncbi:hypothetical protein HPB47_019519 [Ixodes persulcatus]|uniref:Uncharacterized protein n=1 Tax=Ixodes persulcatus TaxID=34615 RepID=A0AC60QK74_IXOPE|nr:hypothetical protein HPB47_019519 [Ixodes persulcatus]
MADVERAIGDYLAGSPDREEGRAERMAKKLLDQATLFLPGPGHNSSGEPLHGYTGNCRWPPDWQTRTGLPITMGQNNLGPERKASHEASQNCLKNTNSKADQMEVEAALILFKRSWQREPPTLYHNTLGSLTAELITRLSSYYGWALKSHEGDVNAMHNAVMADQNASLFTVESAVAEAPLRFNVGSQQASAAILMELNPDPSKKCMKMGVEKDLRRSAASEGKRAGQDNIQRAMKKHAGKMQTDYAPGGF